ncbi:MAG: DNA-protecting protein DprA [Clostridiaceae bacterium]|nr:DNA-protecting protein DprA [Clostridiaceae bacterium]
MDDIRYWIWLTNLPGIGSVKLKRIIDVFHSAEAVWKASKSDIESTGLFNKQDIANLMNKDLDTAYRILKKSKMLGIDIININDERYPSRLKQIYDPPGVLYVKGKLRRYESIAVAVVGSRNASPYGKNIAESLSFQLAQRGIMIVSGAARGIDACAHKGALKAGGQTIAVLGCGIDIDYPPENAELIDYIKKFGAVISEYPPGTQPIPGYFPARNRIISGLSCGVLVVEAGKKSGSLITADLALEQGRDVFAVPGNIDRLFSKGTNNLIRQGAKLVTCVEDILEELPINYEGFSHNNNDLTDVQPAEIEIPEEEKDVLKHLSSEPVHIDELCRKSGISINKISAILILLEMKGMIRQMPGKYFVRI